MESELSALGSGAVIMAADHTVSASGGTRGGDDDCSFADSQPFALLSYGSFRSL